MSEHIESGESVLRTGSLTIDDVDGQPFEVHYLEAGDPDGPLALCLHGYPDSAWTWRHLMPELAASGFHAIAPFNRGYAPTAIPGDGLFQAGVLGVDANRIHEAFGADPSAVIIGHDWGAMAVYAAVGLEPQRWARAVTAAVMPGPSAAEAFFSYDQLKMSWYMFFQLTPMAELFIPADDYAYIGRLWQDWSPGTNSDEDVKHFVDCMPGPENLLAALSYYRHTLSPEFQDDRLAQAQAAVFATPTIPLLYLHGEDDGCMSPEIAATVGDHLDRATSHAAMLADAGHFLHLDQPARFNSLVMDFLSGD